MEIQVIQVPYDCGRKDFRMGKGPGHLVKHGLAALRAFQVDSVEVEELAFEQGTTFRILRALSDLVSAAVRRGHLPLVLAGGCISSVGTLAGLGPGRTGVVWLDAHGDFNTPETTLSGFVDGMALATATGRCWRNLTRSVPGFQAISEDNVILIGARDLDPDEQALLEASAVARVGETAIRERGVRDAVGSALSRLNADRVYLHVDLDVLDVSEARVNLFSSPGGLRVDELVETVRLVGAHKPVVAAAITAYDPSYDADGKALHAATLLIAELNSIQATRLAKA